MGRAGDILRKVYGAVEGKPWNFSWFIEGKIAASGRPMSEKEVRWLETQGIRAILSLTESPLDGRWLTNLEMDYQHTPIRDHSVASLDAVIHAIDFIERMMEQKKPLLVHCAAGLGRTGTILACYLVKSRELEAEEAIRIVRQARPGSVEKDQDQSVKAYEESLKKMGA